MEKMEKKIGERRSKKRPEKAQICLIMVLNAYGEEDGFIKP